MQLFFIIFLSLISILLSVYAIIQHFKGKKEKTEWERLSDEKIRQVKCDSKEYIRETIDKISETIHDYENKSDRDILMSIVLALATYGRRIDRIDDKLDIIYNYQFYIDTMNSHIQKISDYCIVLNDRIKELDVYFTTCKTSLQNTSMEVAILNQHFCNTTELEGNIEKSIDKLNEYAPRLSLIYQKVNQIIKDMENVASVFDTSSVDKIKNIEKTSERSFKFLEGIHTDLRDLSNKINQLESEISMVKSGISTIESDISEIESAVDEYGYDNLYSKLGNIDSSISEVKSSISSLESDVFNLKYGIG